ncbi:MAG: TolC family protein [Candidatus Cloacimonetes bacterium]|nr:TolC family protein [Candidatus Cloacimonadota bacterium]
MKKYMMLITLILMFSFVLHAENLNVKDVIEMGLENSYDMNIQDYYLRNAKNDLYSSYLDLLPGVDYSISRTEYSDDTVSETGQIQISESISSNDSRYFSIKNSHNSYKKGKIDYKIVRRELVFNIINKYIDVLESKENLELAKQNVKTAQLDYDQTQVLKEHGKASRLDLQQSQISLSQARLDSLKAYDEHINTKIELCHFINVNYDPEYNFKELSYEFKNPAKIDFTPEQNLSVVSMQQDIKQSKLSLLQNTLEFFPTLSFSINKSFDWEETNPLDFNDEQPYSFTLQLSYPLMNSLINYPDNKSYSNNLKVRQLQLEQTIREKQKEYTFYNTSYQQAKRSLELAKKQIELTELHYDLIRQKYDLGEADLTDLEKARSDLFNSKYNRINKFYDLIILQENINLLTNKKLMGKY